ncbi:MAG: FkbM family methyltransferase [Solirubrobacteraceae bacterium]
MLDRVGLAEVLTKREPHPADELRELLAGGAPLVVLGAGNLGGKIAEFVRSSDIELAAVADNGSSRWGESLHGATVQSPADLPRNLKEKAAWVVAIWSPGHAYARTHEGLLESGVRHPFPAAALMQLFPDRLLPHFHFQTPDFYLQHARQITEAFESLADDESRRQFLAHTDARINLRFDALAHADVQRQYFPPDVVSLSTTEVFLDAGAFDGDTLRAFAEATENRFEKYIALEPDPANYEQLVRVAAEYPEGVVETFPYAVGAENETVRFNASGGIGAAISETGSVTVQCKRIDDAFSTAAPTYLKFDIEGAELDALEGAQETIARCKPKLAVCIYHRPEDLWRIVLFLRERFSFYDFYVRTHQYDGLEFVLYAIPR